MKRNKTVKNIILALVAIVSLVVLFFTVAPAFMLATVSNPTTNYAKYDDYKNEFSVIVEWLTEKYDGEKEVNLAVEVNRETRTSYLYDFGAKVKVEAPGNILEALSTIDRKAFNSDSDLTSIKIAGKRVCFCTFDGEYALVYSQNGRPWSVLGRNVFSKKLGQGWYHCSFSK